NVVQLDFARKSAGGNGGEAASEFEVPPSLVEDEYERLGGGIETDRWWDRLSPEQKDEALDHGLERIAKNGDQLKFGDNERWHRAVTTVASSDAPHLEDIFVKHARTVPGADSEEALRKKLAYYKNNPRANGSITVATFIYWAKQCGANFEPWYENDQGD